MTKLSIPLEIEKQITNNCHTQALILGLAFVLTHEKWQFISALANPKSQNTNGWVLQDRSCLWAPDEWTGVPRKRQWDQCSTLLSFWWIKAQSARKTSVKKRGKNSPWPSLRYLFLECCCLLGWLSVCGAWLWAGILLATTRKVM